MERLLVHTFFLYFHINFSDPPTFDNPVYLEPKGSNPDSSVEAKVTCSINFPGTFSRSKGWTEYLFCKHRVPLKIVLEASELFYDHPPSTGSYRAASLPEPAEDCIKRNIIMEPIYDEIPSSKQRSNLSILSTTKSGEDLTCIYVNTIKNK